MRSSAVSAAGSLRVICGPTAAGKSDLALALAERVPMTIVSADSRQIYRGFDIGTAKPSRDERARVPHRGIDIVDPTERYSAAAWAEHARAWLAEARATGREPVVVGGAGFYVRALIAPLFEEPPLDPDVRHGLAGVLDSMSTAALRRWVDVLDAERARLGRAQLLRAIEVALLTGVPLSEWHRHAARAPGPTPRYLVVDPGGALRDRIRSRAAAMLDAGWVEEAAALDARLPATAPAWNATGYAHVRALARGEIGRREAVERIVIETRQYAKRQRTWIRHQLPPDRVTVLDPRRADAVDRALEWWWNDGEVGG